MTQPVVTPVAVTGIGIEPWDPTSTPGPDTTHFMHVTGVVQSGDFQTPSYTAFHLTPEALLGLVEQAVQQLAAAGQADLARIREAARAGRRARGQQ